MVHMWSQSVIYRAPMAHAYGQHISEELCGRFFVYVAAIT